MNTLIINSKIEERHGDFFFNLEINKKKRWSKLNIRQNNF